MPADPSGSPVAVPVAFARLLRRRGIAVGGSAVGDFTDALAVLAPTGRDGVYWAGRATLVRRPDDLVAYDEAFAAFWEGATATPVSGSADPLPVTLAVDTDSAGDGANDPDSEGDPDPLTQQLRFSPVEVLRQKDLGSCTDEERAELFAAIAHLRVGGATRRSRRLTPTHRTTGRPDLGRTVRAAMRTGGEPFHRHHRKPTRTTRRLVLLIDVSASMDPYARALIRFAHAAVLARSRVEVFTVGTRLTRVTRQLHSHDPDAAMAAATGAVPDWSGGTRLGDALRSFNDGWGVAGMARGAEVVVLSDGWDRGDPADLAAEMARLARVAHRVTWVNPLKAAPGYQPLAQGMAAALPHVDRFVTGHSLAALEDLATLLAAPTSPRHTGTRG